MTKDTELPFEQSFTRLEQILEKMNSGGTTLDESLKRFEEAEQRIVGCSKRLNDAERRVETLIKNRSGELVIDAEGQPTTAQMPLPQATRYS